MFDNEMVKLEKKEFNGMQARLMSWGMHVGMVEFFSKRLTPMDLKDPGNAIWPSVSHARVCDVIRKGTLVHYRSFPPSWAGCQGAAQNTYIPTTNPKQKTKGGGARGGAGGAGGDIARDGPTGGPSDKKIRIEGGLKFEGPITHCHNTIKELLKELHVKFKGRMALKWILKAANKTWADLPKSDKWMDGRSNRLCYTYMFGNFPWGHKCEFKHPPAREFDKQFIKQCHAVLKPGLDYIYKTKPAAPGG